jgi:hypothetical protein
MLLIIGFVLVLLVIMIVANTVWPDPPEVRRAKKLVREHNKRMNSVIEPRLERRGQKTSPWDNIGGKV